ncbi:MAG: hypothetical protein QOJ15_7215, partial [Bradyrhizobium sp.]|nr:hypothetical protein [Bradyrhizobium sp.]
AGRYRLAGAPATGLVSENQRNEPALARCAAPCELPPSPTINIKK